MVPKGWKKCPAKDVCKSINVGVVIKPSEYYVAEGDGVRAFRSANVREGFINNSDWVYFSREGHEKNKKSELKAGDVLIVRSGYPGTACVVTPEFAGSNAIDIVIARPDPSKVIPEYLCVFTNSEIGRSQILNLQGGMAQKHLNVGAYKTLELMLPSVQEQKEIARIFSVWDEAIATTEQLLANSEQQKKALMQQLLTGKRRLPGFEGAWEKVRVGKILAVRKEKKLPSEDCPLYSLTIEKGVTPKTDRYNREALVADTATKKYKQVKPLDIVYNPANLRWGAINYSRENHDVVVSPIYEVLYVKDEGCTDLGYVAQALMRPDQIRRFASMVEGTLMERKAVKIEPFLATPIMIPRSLDEQKAISSVLCQMDESIDGLRREVDLIKREKSALMQQLLTGKRRVKVDQGEG